MKSPTVQPYELSPVARAMHVDTWRMRFMTDRTAMRAQTASVDGLTASRVNAVPSVSSNIPAAGCEGHKYILYWCNRQHRVTVDQREPEELRAGELMLLDSRTFFEVAFPVSCTASSLIIDAARFERDVAGIAVQSGRRVSPFLGLDVAVRAVIDVAIAHGAKDGLPQVSEHLFGALSHLMAVAPLAGDDAGESHQAGARRHREVRSFIELHYADPDLSVERIAKSIGISTRYAAKSFVCAGDTPRRYILAVRLERAAEMLRDCACRDRSITEIAFSCGFNSASHFSNAFRSCYGLSPREYRTRDLRLA